MLDAIAQWIRGLFETEQPLEGSQVPEWLRFNLWPLYRGHKPKRPPGSDAEGNIYECRGGRLWYHCYVQHWDEQGAWLTCVTCGRILTAPDGAKEMPGMPVSVRLEPLEEGHGPDQTTDVRRVARIERPEVARRSATGEATGCEPTRGVTPDLARAAHVS